MIEERLARACPMPLYRGEHGFTRALVATVTPHLPAETEERSEALTALAEGP